MSTEKSGKKFRGRRNAKSGIIIIGRAITRPLSSRSAPFALGRRVAQTKKHTSKTGQTTLVENGRKEKEAVQRAESRRSLCDALTQPHFGGVV